MRQPQAHKSFVKVYHSKIILLKEIIFCSLSTDYCDVGNGGCDPNADCSHPKDSNAVTCTCKAGYAMDVPATGTQVVCKGISFKDYTTQENNILFIANRLLQGRKRWL